jgi:hypothetical protein
VLCAYLDRAGRRRELIERSGAEGSMLVIDRDPRSARDDRLVAHLCADEPPGNASIVCAQYIGHVQGSDYRVRRVTEDDATRAPLPDDAPGRFVPDGGELRAAAGSSAFRLGLVRAALSIPELRWRRLVAGDAPSQIVSLRHVVAALQSYEPACRLTGAALRSHTCSKTVSSTVLRQEHARLCASPIVLNRRLREKVLATVGRGEPTMSAIAVRCGRVKRDCRGNISGETSWLARRIGLLPEGGALKPTPWVHSDVLALIARAGLGIDPREVEL